MLSMYWIVVSVNIAAGLVVFWGYLPFIRELFSSILSLLV